MPEWPGHLPRNTFKQALSKGERQVGLWSGLASAIATEIIAGAGFDWIVIDTPPVLPISDARVIADLSDGVLMVVNSTATLSRLAKRASQEFRRESILGVVLNRTSDPSATRYSAYGYGYGIQSADHISREPSA